MLRLTDLRRASAILIAEALHAALMLPLCRRCRCHVYAAPLLIFHAF